MEGGQLGNSAQGGGQSPESEAGCRAGDQHEEKNRIKSETIENSVTVCDDDTDDIDYDILSKF